MFSINHIIWLVISLAIVLIMLLISIKKKFSFKVAIRVMAIVSLISEISKVFTHINMIEANELLEIGGGGYISAKALPLHLCSIFIFIFFYLALSNNEKSRKVLINFFVPIGLIGASIAILFATSGVSFIEPEVYQCFIYHSFMVWFALYLIITNQVNLTFKTYLFNVVTLFALVIIMIWINGALQVYDTNFFFVVRPPLENLPYLTLKYGWYVYFIHLAISGILIETLVSLPYMIKERKSKKIK